MACWCANADHVKITDLILLTRKKSMDLSWMDLDLDGFGFVLSLRTHDVRKPFFVRLGFVSCALEE